MNSMFRPVLVLLVIAAVALTSTNNVKAADVDAGADVATAYVFRGKTLNDSWVVQPYLAVGNSDKHEWLQPLTLGVWANFDLDDNKGGDPESGQFSEIDLYASYELPINSEHASLSVGYIEYVYPSASPVVRSPGAVAVDTDADRELNLIAKCENTLLSPEVAVYWGVEGPNLKDIWEFQLSGSHDEPLNADENLLLNLGGTVSFRYDDSDTPGTDDGVSYVLLSAGLSYSIFSARADFWIETDDKVQMIDDEVVGVFGIGGAM